MQTSNGRNNAHSPLSMMHSFTKIKLTTDNIPTHTLDNGIIMMNVFEYLLA